MRAYGIFAAMRPEAGFCPEYPAKAAIARSLLALPVPVTRLHQPYCNSAYNFDRHWYLDVDLMEDEFSKEPV